MGAGGRGVGTRAFNGGRQHLSDKSHTRWSIRVALGSDHAGFELKEAVKTFPAAVHLEGLDVGPHSRDPVNLAGTIIDLFPAKDASFPGQPSPGSGGQHHAYIIGLEDYEPWLEHFRAHDVPTRLMADGLIRLSMYVDDPDGCHIELMVPFSEVACYHGATNLRQTRAHDGHHHSFVFVAFLRAWVV